MKKDNLKSQIIIYKTEDGLTKIDVRFDGGTVWLTQNILAELFQTTKQNISLHIKNIFEETELSREATVKKYLTVQNEGRRKISRELEHYNLDMIISVGYRVKSSIATAFRQWATAHLREYLVIALLLLKVINIMKRREYVNLDTAVDALLIYHLKQLRLVKKNVNKINKLLSLQNVPRLSAVELH